MPEIELKGDSLDPVAFLRTYVEADDDADVEVRIAYSSDGVPHVLVHVGQSPFALTVQAARLIASIAEDELQRLPDDDDRGLPNLILGLRAAADEAEAA